MSATALRAVDCAFQVPDRTSGCSVAAAERKFDAIQNVSLIAVDLSPCQVATLRSTTPVKLKAAIDELGLDVTGRAIGSVQRGRSAGLAGSFRDVTTAEVIDAPSCGQPAPKLMTLRFRTVEWRS